jgi:hypothetical protein
MSWNDQSQPRGDIRHGVFISYYHNDDQYYRNRFEELFEHLFINKSVEPGDIDMDLSTEYIKRLIQQNYIGDTSVVLVLVGQNTWGRKHVDWEISAALSRKVGGYSGLLGVLLPEFQMAPDDKFRYDDVPPRLADNVKTGYAKVYKWGWVCGSDTRIRDAIEETFRKRITDAYKIDNSRVQFQNNRSS